jgi:NACHT domain
VWVNEKQQTLFCPGIPGAGKTILASIVIDHLSQEKIRESPVAYLYCSYDKRQAQTASSQLSIVLRQFVEQQSGQIPESVRSLYDLHIAKGSRPTLADISDTLLKVVMGLEGAFLVVDALDECSDETRKELLNQVRKLQASSSLSLMATSRPSPSLGKDFHGAMQLDIRAQEQDIGYYLDSRLSELSSSIQQDEKLKQEIKHQIVETADGM